MSKRRAGPPVKTRFGSDKSDPYSKCFVIMSPTEGRHKVCPY